MPFPTTPFMTSTGDVTTLLDAYCAGERDALPALFDRVYQELHRQAHAQRARWRRAPTLSTTALVHEAYLKMAGGASPDALESRAHFLGIAARAMRQILVDQARRRTAAKRGGDAVVLPLDEALIVAEAQAEEVLALDESLTRLAARHERAGRVVECRFFGGMTVEETAVALGVSTPTVKRDWRFAQAWLFRDMHPDADPPVSDAPSGAASGR